MNKGTTVCFQTTSEISETLDKIAEEKKLNISEVIHIIIDKHLKNNYELTGGVKNYRRFERKKVDLPAYVGDPRWQRHDFKEINILDISIGGIKFAVPKGTKLDIQNDKNNDSDTEKLIIIFRLPSYNWPIKVQIAPQRVSESNEEIQIAADLVNPDFHAYSAIQQYLSS
jgi:hypothetical protein